MRTPTQMIWLSYFIVSIAAVGATFAFIASSPFYLLGRFVPSARKLADRILQRGVQTLMALQPWFLADVHLPRQPGPVLMVSNHRSHLDAFILLSQVAGIRIMAKQSLFRVPFLGTMMRLMDQIPVGNNGIGSYYLAMEDVRRHFKNGETVHIFPELTRCQPGFQGVQNFSLLPFQVAIQEKVVVLPVIFKGTDFAWAKGSKGIRFRSPIVARALEPVDATLYSSAQHLKSEIQARIAEAWQWS